MARVRSIGLFLAVAVLLGGCKTELYSHLGENEANEMVAILLERGIAADRTADAKERTLTVNVEKGQFADAVELLKSHGYPRPKFASVPEIFPGDGLVTSPVAERARLIYATSQDLSRTLSEIDGVLTARVQVVLPDSDPMRQQPTTPSASVFIRHGKGAAIDALVPQIKTMVANSVPGVTYDHVTVVLVPVESRVDGPALEADSLTSVAGLWVHKSSAGLARWLIGLLAVVALGSSGGLVLTLHRQRQRSPKPETV
ncbi:MAG TPA: type III secretion inner membrane ring lipoprotein SctJ [Actinocrinis sp.]|nr:type III secretion inner membrane ring lipoprotein SctJ [Actinocrinis sp.]